VPGIIDGRQWLENRARALENELRGELEEDHRRAVEAELVMVRAELGRTRRRWRRWLLGAGRLPGS
jgi:hypothetical protein